MMHENNLWLDLKRNRWIKEAGIIQGIIQQCSQSQKLAPEGTVTPFKRTKDPGKKKDLKIINPSVLGRWDGEKTAIHQQEREHRRRQAFLVLAHHFNYYKKK